MDMQLNPGEIIGMPGQNDTPYFGVCPPGAVISSIQGALKPDDSAISSMTPTCSNGTVLPTFGFVNGNKKYSETTGPWSSISTYTDRAGIIGLQQTGIGYKKIGGSRFTMNCPAGQSVSGIVGKYNNNRINSVKYTCGTLAPVQPPVNPPSYQPAVDWFYDPVLDNLGMQATDPVTGQPQKSLNILKVLIVLIALAAGVYYATMSSSQSQPAVVAYTPSSPYHM